MTKRNVYIVLPAMALPYASHCVATLFANCLEDVDLTLITDGPEDKEEIERVIGALDLPSGAEWRVADKVQADERAAEALSKYSNIAAFRNGHPCWRKVTDPLLFAQGDDEQIILDPDLYFPNKFTFEPTPAAGVYLMRQGPNCLYPPQAVTRSFEIPVKLANHVDIGVAQWRRSAADLDWLDWFVGELGVMDYTPYMHIEAIAWSALAMRIGGGYLDPKAWHCWQRGHAKRLLIAAGASGAALLRMEPLDRIKCIHVSGPSKWWVAEAKKNGTLKDYGGVFDAPTRILPFVELSEKQFKMERAAKDMLGRLGYYKLTNSE